MLIVEAAATSKNPTFTWPASSSGQRPCCCSTRATAAPPGCPSRPASKAVDRFFGVVVRAGRGIPLRTLALRLRHRARRAFEAVLLQSHDCGPRGRGFLSPAARAHDDVRMVGLCAPDAHTLVAATSRRSGERRISKPGIRFRTGYASSSIGARVRPRNHPRGRARDRLEEASYPRVDRCWPGVDRRDVRSPNLLERAPPVIAGTGLPRRPSPKISATRAPSSAAARSRDGRRAFCRDAGPQCERERVRASSLRAIRPSLALQSPLRASARQTRKTRRRAELPLRVFASLFAPRPSLVLQSNPARVSAPNKWSRGGSNP